MSRDHRKLEVFQAADELVLEVYRCTAGFPTEERYGLQSQIRRAMVSVAANIVEGCERNSDRDYLHFLVMSRSSAAEAAYLFGLSHRLGYVTDETHEAIHPRIDRLVRSLQKLHDRVRERSLPG